MNGKLFKQCIEASAKAYGFILQNIDEELFEMAGIAYKNRSNDTIAVKYVLPDYVTQLLKDIYDAMENNPRDGIDKIHDCEIFERIQEVLSRPATERQPCDNCKDNEVTLVWKIKNQFVLCPYCGRKL